MTVDKKVTIELSLKEIEILIGLIASTAPSDKDRESSLFRLYSKFRLKLKEFEKYESM